jgi:hypothetical protein
MIRYDLECADGHGFDGWFRSGEDFDRQAAAGLVTCPHCGSAAVSRALMTPAVRPSRSKAAAAAPVPAMPSAGEATPTQPVAVAADPRRAAVMAALRALREKVTAETDYVGPAFAEEARKMHYGEREARGIWGEASGEDVRALIDEGIEVHPLPVLPEDRN